jgi:hypothetical protein
MITTTQVRAIINKHAPNSYGVYTNKTAKYTGQIRRVKCYFRNNIKLLKALQRAAGKENVTLTTGGNGYCSGGPGITVKCVLG